MDIKGISLQNLSLDELRRLVDASLQPASPGSEPADAAGSTATPSGPTVDPGEALLLVPAWADDVARSLPWPSMPPPAVAAADARLEASIAYILQPFG